VEVFIKFINLLYSCYRELVGSDVKLIFREPALTKRLLRVVAACCGTRRGERRWFPARPRNGDSRIEESSSNNSPFPRRIVLRASRTLRIPRESATPRAVHRNIVSWAPMIPSGSFTADDLSSSIVTGASCIRTVTTISHQIGSSASTRATYAPENGNESLLGADQQQKQQQRDSNTELLFWIRDGGRGAKVGWSVQDWRWRQVVPEAVGVGERQRRDKGGCGDSAERDAGGRAQKIAYGENGGAKDRQEDGDGGEREREAEIGSGRRKGSSIGRRAPQMRGPQGPVRGGVTRCGRPPPLCRGRGRGKTSRLPTPSFLSATGDHQLNMSFNSSVLRGSILSYRIERGTMFFTGNKMFSRRVVRFLESWGIAKQAGFPVNDVMNGEIGRMTNVTRGTTTKEINERGDDEVRRISRVKGLFKESHPPVAVSPRASSCWRFSALNAVWRVPRRWLVLKNTAPERSRRDTASCAALKPDRRRPSRLITACRTRRRQSARCAICRRLPRHPGAASSSPTPCRRSARSGHRYRTTACRDRGRPTSRGWCLYWLTKAKTACIWTSMCPKLLTVSRRRYPNEWSYWRKNIAW